ncbi:4Fe-4S ferredoxin iron-sulfur binding domain protein [Methanocaldococcus villosus KIN24-T80]|uniref:4Fe-4S ferredoxin iron-sulfur binding domain protein n=1 Tax=Methanocaldococcus villosus KIN24-T80 TaxID=1069083 RepID=N6V3J7_9EURY|nr:4Fe-4S binding protein [Methanocaldococcus villosus]ENN96833.1 4Fe-4S ferredoxin iron-sulfur binding domain protein [Methanocaldococcus villosus KIN24-T80]
MKISSLIKCLFLNVDKKYSKTKELDINECIGCGLCTKHCPTEAIKIFKFRNIICEHCGVCLDICDAIIGNRFSIDESKCKKCGICLLFCSIPVIKNNVPKPKTPIILEYKCNECGLCSCEAIDLKNKKIDENKCKFCLECVKKCPLKAIITPEEYVKSMFIKVDVESCIFCRMCEEVCPIKK